MTSKPFTPRLARDGPPPGPPPQPADTLWSIFARFLRFGVLAWGGPVAQIAMIRRELVDELHWLDPRKFNRVLAVYQALPGPEAHELCVYFGMIRRGRLGGLLAGLGFMLPGFSLMLALAWAYQRLGIHPLVAAAMAGCQPAVVALILRATHRLGAQALRDTPLLIIAIVATLLTLIDAHFAIVLTAGGAAYAAWRSAERFKLVLAIFTPMVVIAVGALILAQLGAVLPIGLSPSPAAAASPPSAISPSPGGAAWTELLAMGLRAGLLSFGGAYTAIPFLRRDAVENHAWMTPGAFLDGIALGAVIPAPLIILGTFVGFQAGGLPGALIVTAAIFAPAFAFTLLGHDAIEHLVDNRTFHALLDGVTAAVIGLIAATALQFARATLLAPDWTPSLRAILIAAGALAAIILIRTKWATPAIMLAAALVGLLWR